MVIDILPFGNFTEVFFVHFRHYPGLCLFYILEAFFSSFSRDTYSLYLLIPSTCWSFSNDVTPASKYLFYISIRLCKACHQLSCQWSALKRWSSYIQFTLRSAKWIEKIIDVRDANQCFLDFIIFWIVSVLTRAANGCFRYENSACDSMKK